MSHSTLEDWLRALFDRDTTFTPTLANVPGYLRLPLRWRVGFAHLSDHLFYYVTQGGFDAVVNGETARVLAGDMIWIGRGATINLRLREGESAVVWRFRLQAFNAQHESLAAPRPYWNLAQARHCESWFQRIVEETSTPDALNTTHLRGLLICLLSELERHPQTSGEARKGLTRAQREKIVRYFGENAHLRPTPTELARLVGLTPDYFTRCFRHTFGQAPRHWLTEERIRLAAVRLQESDRSISEIAIELGYEDVFLFSRQFKAVFGVSPSHYRQQQQEVVPY